MGVKVISACMNVCVGMRGWALQWTDSIACINRHSVEVHLKKLYTFLKVWWVGTEAILRNCFAKSKTLIYLKSYFPIQRGVSWSNGNGIGLRRRWS